MTNATLTRRRLLLGALSFLAGGLGLAWLSRRRLAASLLAAHHPGLVLTPAPRAKDAPCVVTSRQVEGPFYIPSPERRDVAEDRLGRPLDLRLQLTRHPSCSPIAGAAVEIWHCDAEGRYSGYPEEISHDAWKTLVFLVTKGERDGPGEVRVPPQTATRFLRGLQRSDAEGWVAFRTIVPGWYTGRVPHVHVRASLLGGEQLVTQLYFERDLHDRLCATTPPYSLHGKCPTTFDTDGALARGADRVEGVLLDVPWTDDGPLDAVARLSLARA
jgi:protocatechuate 3,4-dioxygenase beta subunit